MTKISELKTWLLCVVSDEKFTDSQYSELANFQDSYQLSMFIDADFFPGKYSACFEVSCLHSQLRYWMLRLPKLGDSVSLNVVPMPEKS